MPALTFGKGSRRDAPGVISKDSCMKWGNNRGVMAEEGPAGACITSEGGTVAGMFWRIKASWAGINKPAGAAMFGTKGPPTEGGRFTVAEGVPGMGGGTNGGEWWV